MVVEQRVCYLGAIKALEERKLKPDIIAGTSAGALAGVFMPMDMHLKRWLICLKTLSLNSL